ncbi:uncharacterized protein V6R79_011771 [Siganus canaliculatus]
MEKGKNREKERGEKERGEKERGEKERGEKERGEKERGEKERGEKERGEKERGEKERGEKERGEKERGEKERGEKERGVSGECPWCFYGLHKPTVSEWMLTVKVWLSVKRPETGPRTHDHVASQQNEFYRTVQFKQHHTVEV